jgi:hypothetical protein
MKLFLAAATALSLSLATLHAIEITAHDATITVAAGKAEPPGHSIIISSPATFTIAPAPIQTVTDEALKLSTDKPAGFAKGTRLRGCNARDVNASGSFVRGSLEIHLSKGGDLLKEGGDYLLDPEWAHVGLGPHSRVTANDTVYASYRYSLRRMDTVQVAADGKVSLKNGQAHISAPVPPDADTGCTAIAHVFINYGATTITNEDIYPILESPAQAVKRGHLPHPRISCASSHRQHAGPHPQDTRQTQIRSACNHRLPGRFCHRRRQCLEAGVPLRRCLRRRIARAFSEGEDRRAKHQRRRLEQQAVA